MRTRRADDTWAKAGDTWTKRGCRGRDRRDAHQSERLVNGMICVRGGVGFQPERGVEVVGAIDVRTTGIPAGDVRTTRYPRAQTVWVGVAPQLAPTL